MLDTIVNIVIVVIILLFIFKMFQKITVNISRPARKQEIDPTSTGERLKKYIVKASKMNPKTAKQVKLSRTKWSEGGKVAKVYGCLPTKNCTRFVLQPRGFFSRKVLMYCPTDLHSSLHNKEIMIYGTSIDSAGGYYYPIPNGQKMKNSEVFQIVSEQFEADLRKMLTMDSLQMELEQTYQGIAGYRREDQFLEEPEEVIEYVNEGDEGYENS